MQINKDHEWVGTFVMVGDRQYQVEWVLVFDDGEQRLALRPADRAYDSEWLLSNPKNYRDQLLPAP